MEGQHAIDPPWMTCFRDSSGRFAESHNFPIFAPFEGTARATWFLKEKLNEKGSGLKNGGINIALFS